MGRSPTTRVSSPRFRPCAGCASTARSTIVLSHLGRPDGKVVPRLTAAAGSRRTRASGSALRSRSPTIASDAEAEAAVARLGDGDVVVMENVRFHPEEEANDPGFARQLAALGDLYVNDAFGTAHRAHASTEGIAHDLPSVAGFLMEAELTALGTLMHDPAKPYRLRDRRREGQRQSRRVLQSARARRRLHHRRGDGQYVLGRARRRGRLVAARRRPRAGESDLRTREEARMSRSTFRPMRSSRPHSTPRPKRRRSASTELDGA